jgi:hypothetical protein
MSGFFLLFFFPLLAAWHYAPEDRTLDKRCIQLVVIIVTNRAFGLLAVNL